MNRMEPQVIYLGNAGQEKNPSGFPTAQLKIGH